MTNGLRKIIRMLRKELLNDAAAQEYSWFQDWMEEAAEQQYFEAPLASIPDRLQDAKAELMS